MIKIGYFIQSHIKPSETFIYDLIVDLHQNKNIDLTVIYGGKKNIFSIPYIKVININYVVSGLKKRFLELFSRIFPRFSMNYEIGYAKKKLAIKLKQHFDVIYVEYASNAVLLSDYLTNSGIPFIVHTHGYDITCKFRDSKYSNIFFHLHKKSLKIITPSKHLKRYLIVKGFDQNKIEVVYNGIDLKEYVVVKETDVIESYGIDQSKPYVLFVGRITRQKGIIHLVNAIKSVFLHVPHLIYILPDS